MAETSSNPFTRGTVLLLILVGSIAFLGLLYGLGSGDFSRQDNNGKGHAASNSLIGYSAFAEILKNSGAKVSLGRSGAVFNDANLLVVTPSQFSSGEEFDELMKQRQYSGPTLVIMPKWLVRQDDELKSGWVRLGGALPFKALKEAKGVESDIKNDDVKMFSNAQLPKKGAPLKSAFGEAGGAPFSLALLKGKNIRAIVRDPKSGKTIAGYWDDGGVYESLDGLAPRNYNENDEYDSYPVVFVADPDLFNNMGMADKKTALHALAMINAMDDGFDFPIVFDLTFNGLGSSENLLSLAFRPPFLAATICFLIAAAIIGWQTFARFAPPISGGRAINFGKTALVRNSAAMLKLMSRQHLLREPYLSALRHKAARGLGLSPTLPEEELTASFDRASRDDRPPFSVLENALKRAKKPQEIADAAAQLDIWKKETL
jgi:hypothetical protein